ncbi:hypothetical protein SPRG_20948 [Saprolegnia parasitica CBS 223.65]|uniref:Uncharacterized protein n=1 Tax=Saprolegnia parasitica (strain CBS 223.65) TaxID=695850 RepID=A0A067C5R0_SAPPC|nr:hypothetical protein SPRG_20948 [Saprolegnia parasitica CBS 223.65]KDO22127.1 hypothetical protein SPRG_20948 [Saprolegnia parasitica CBS 223.65]|eukprot:XP_012207190.1 hypothetical protein SPRG_20948 [Saprolegnia parasitica CBS 223.65]
MVWPPEGPARPAAVLVAAQHAPSGRTPRRAQHLSRHGRPVAAACRSPELALPLDDQRRAWARTAVGCA